MFGYQKSVLVENGGERRRVEGQGERNFFLETFEHLDPAMLEVHPASLLRNLLSPSFGLCLFESSRKSSSRKSRPAPLSS